MFILQNMFTGRLRSYAMCSLYSVDGYLNVVPQNLSLYSIDNELIAVGKVDKILLSIFTIQLS